MRALIDNWMPAGDQGIIATRAYDVLGAHTPLVGQYSLVSTVTGHLTYSPGPMLYWLIALPSRFGAPQTIALTIGLANALAALGIVALARRRGGVPLMLAVAVAVALMCRSFMSEALHDPWNPSAGLLPFALLVVLCWSLACGEHRLLGAVALVGSFTAQCQVAFLAPTLGLLAVGLIGLAVSRGAFSRLARSASLPAARLSSDRTLKGTPKGRAAGSRSDPPVDSPSVQDTRSGNDRMGTALWPWMLAALVVLVACWTPPVIDELNHSPGNLTLLYRAATERSKTMGATAGTRAVIRAVGIAPRWLRVPGDPFDNRLSDVLSAPGALATGSCVALLIALVMAVFAGAWRRRIDVSSGAAIGLVLCIALAAVAADTPVSSFKVVGYTLWWGSVAGMWVWLIVGFSALTLAREGALVRRFRLERLARARPEHVQPEHVQPEHVRPARQVRPSVMACAAGLGAAIAVGGTVAAAQRPDAHSPEYGPIASIERQLEQAKIPHNSTVWLRSSLGGVASPLSQAVKFLLRREGLRVLQYGAIARLGPWYEIDHRRYDYTVYAYDRFPPHDKRARVIARVTMREPERLPAARPLGVPFRVRPVVVSLAPAGPRPAPASR